MTKKNILIIIVSAGILVVAIVAVLAAMVVNERESKNLLPENTTKILTEQKIQKIETTIERNKN